jgi:two-component system, NarL family, nitrate/nitrite response regulator NarL
MSCIRVLVASHIRLYCEGLQRVLRESPEFALIGTAATAAEAVEQTHRLDADVALLDMAMSGAFTVAREVVRVGGRSKIVALGMPEDETQVLSCAQLGISGYVTRDGSVAEVVAAIKAAARGEVHCSPRIAGSLIRRIAALSTERQGRPTTGSLTTREAQILKLVQEGMSNKMISRTLGIELPTVKNHVHSILGKLGIHRRAEAISLMYRPEGAKEAASGEH